MNKERLLNVARALRESPNADRFDMSRYAHDCKTPACAFGHYAARGDLQNWFEIDKFGTVVLAGGVARTVHYDNWRVKEHFGLSFEALDELFQPPLPTLGKTGGCGDAKSAIEAAEYIEQFVADREEQP